MIKLQGSTGSVPAIVRHCAHQFSEHFTMLVLKMWTTASEPLALERGAPCAVVQAERLQERSGFISWHHLAACSGESLASLPAHTTHQRVPRIQDVGTDWRLPAPTNQFWLSVPSLNPPDFCGERHPRRHSLHRHPWSFPLYDSGSGSSWSNDGYAPRRT